MVVELTVENLAIIDKAQLSLGPGFTALTGETGAGKSLLMDALDLALGGRADTDLVRAGAARASVSLALDLGGNPALRSWCDEHGVALEGDTLFVQREVFAEGRSQARLGGKLAPIGTLRALGQRLVDLHGQHDHQSLLDSERHVDFLDEWIGEPCARLKQEVADRYAEASEARRRLAALRSGLRDREQRLDLLRFQVQEIEALDPRPGEMPELETQLARLRNVEKLADSVENALSGLSDDDGALDRMKAAVRTLEDAARLDASLEPLLEPLRTATYTLEDAAFGLRDYSESLEADPEKLEETAARIDALKRLRRKYGEDESAILAFLERATQELDLLSDAEASEEEFAALAEASETALAQACAKLTELRRERAVEFSDLVQAELRDLAMEKARFEVRMEPREADPNGADEVAFYFSANVGEPLRSLSRIASGGEISRVMLAIKCASAVPGSPTLVFDEVDAGLGGRAAAVVARKIEELGAHYQVLVISHLPQIAARATSHFRIEKGEQSGRVTTRVRPLPPSERVEEIARMLAGETVTESALANARELLGA